MSQEEVPSQQGKNLTGQRRINWEYRKKHLPRLRHYNLWNNCRQRAKKLGLDFDLTLEDIVVPKFCPILGIELRHGFKDSSRECSPSVDRILPEKGYVRDNIQVISYLANRMKNNATLEQLILLGEWAGRVKSEISEL